MGEVQRGVIFAFTAYMLWGLFPLFWMLLEHVNSMEVLVSRVIWSFFFTVLFILLIGQRRQLLTDWKQLLHNKADLLRLFTASLIISINWFIYIWAVNNDKVLETSLGYYINPLITVVFGVLIFKERLMKSTIVALVIAALGVVVLTINYGTVPWISLLLAITFGVYGVLKKKIELDATRGLAIETLLILPIAIVTYIYLGRTAPIAFLQIDWQTTVLLMIGGIFTAIPLILFAKGAQSVPLNIMGFIQYFSPTITFLLGVFYFKEKFTHVELIAFGCIWLAVLVFSVPKVWQLSKKKVVH